MKRILLTGAATVALMCSAAAVAHVNVGISIGIPGVVYATPGVVVVAEPDYYYPPVRYVRRPPVVVVPERVYSPRRWYDNDWRGHWDRRGHGRGHPKHHRHPRQDRKRSE